MLAKKKVPQEHIKYVALLRAVNVGGHKVIKMEELVRMFDPLKFKNVKTFIQSGNVIFETSENNAAHLTEKIGKQLLKALGYEVVVLLRATHELAELIKRNPFAKAKLSNNLVQYVTFLSEASDKELATTLTSSSNALEKFHVSDHHVFCLIDKTGGKKLRFSNNHIEKMLKLPGTTRNWNTVCKLAE